MPPPSILRPLWVFIKAEKKQARTRALKPFRHQENLLGVESPPPYLCDQINELIGQVEQIRTSIEPQQADRMVAKLNNLRDQIEALRDWGVRLRSTSARLWDDLHQLDSKRAVAHLNEEVKPYYDEWSKR